MSKPLYVTHGFRDYFVLGPEPRGVSQPNDSYYYELRSYKDSMVVTNTGSIAASPNGVSIFVPDHPMFYPAPQYNISIESGGTLGGGIQENSDGGTITNSGGIGGSVLINAYGDPILINNSGSIAGEVSISSDNLLATVENYGVIGGYVSIDVRVPLLQNFGTIDGGVEIAFGATVFNASLITGSVIVGDKGTGGMNTVTNFGTIGGDLNVGGFDDKVYQLNLVTGGVQLGSNYNGRPQVGGTMENGGTIDGGLYVNYDWSISNTGTINGGVVLRNNNNTLSSSGDITGSGYYGGLHVYGKHDTVSLSGTFSGSGSISGTYDRLIVAQNLLHSGPGDIFVTNGGTLELAAAASTIAAGVLTKQLPSSGEFATIVVDPSANWVIDESSVVSNAIVDNGLATITSAQSVGIRLDGTLINQTTLSGAIHGDGYILNNGTITNSVSFGSGNDLLVLNPAGDFSGVATGEAASTIVLEAGAQQGSLQLSSVSGFGEISVQPGGNWAVAGSLGAATTVVDAGTLVNQAGTIAAGVTVIGGGTLASSGVVGGGVSTGGVLLTDGGTVTNSTTGEIAGSYGVYGLQAATTLANAGLIDASGRYSASGDFGNAVALFAGGSLTNSATGTISGVGGPDTGGVYLGGTGNNTLTNAGTIAGTTHAVQFASGNDSLILLPGESLIGTADGGGGSNTVVLGAGTVQGALQLSGLVNFAEVNELTGGNWSTTGSLATTISVYDRGALVNAGTLADGLTLAGRADLVNDGSVGATRAAAIDVQTNSATIVNAGTVTSSAGGVRLADGGSLVNQAGATVGGIYGVYGLLAATMLTNAGLIDGTGRQNSSGSYGNAVALFGGGDVTNSAGGTISGVDGVFLGGNGADTLVNAGVITGQDHAVQFDTANSRLVVDPGATFGGAVLGDASTLELADGPSAGELRGLGSQLSGFTTLAVDPSAQWTVSEGTGTLTSVSSDGLLALDRGSLVTGRLSGDGETMIDTDTTLTVQGSIAANQTVTFGGTNADLTLQAMSGAEGQFAGFAIGDSITLTNIPFAGAADSFADGKLTVTNGTTTEVLRLAGDYAGETFRLHADHSGDTVITLTKTAPCFARGTRLLTAQGEVKVEDLQVGDLAVTFLGQGSVLKPVRWIGHRRIDLARHPSLHQVRPVRIRAGALAEGRPHSDLVVSPGHRFPIDGALVCADDLVNGASIVQEAPDTVEYWHVELDGHDILLAEGVEAESYQDTGNRDGFDNTNVVGLRARGDATFVPDGEAPEPCLPYGTPSEALRARLRARAEALGWTPTQEPAPWLETDGGRVDAQKRRERYRFDVPAGCREVRLRSRFVRPRDAVAGSSDTRQLGMSLHRLVLVTEVGRRDVRLDAPALKAGFHRVEGEDGWFWRWTDGDALLSLADLALGQTVTAVEIAIEQGLCYWKEPTPKAQAAARSAAADVDERRARTS